MNPSPDAVFETIAGLIDSCRTSEPEHPPTPDLRIESLELDSLELLEFMMNLEEAFQIELDTDTLREDMTVQELQQQIESRLKTTPS